jgi:hypothetical protein
MSDHVQGVPPSGSGCQPTASAAISVASSRSGIPNAPWTLNDRLVTEFAQSFRDGILDGGPSDMMCAAVSWPLAALLRCSGLDCETVETKGVPTEYGTVNHVWIRLSDGRALDPTADQFGYPPVYLGAPLAIHTAQAIEARRAETGNTGSVHESAVAKPCAQETPSSSTQGRE